MSLQRLDSTQLFDVGPNFHKLQIYSDVMEDLIEETPTFTYILRCIKVKKNNDFNVYIYIQILKILIGH